MLFFYCISSGKKNILLLVSVSTGRSEQRVICRAAGRASASCSGACQQVECSKASTVQASTSTSPTCGVEMHVWKEEVTGHWAERNISTSCIPEQLHVNKIRLNMTELIHKGNNGRVWLKPVSDGLLHCVWEMDDMSTGGWSSSLKKLALVIGG